MLQFNNFFAGQVETLKAERDAIECELKSPTTDMKETFLMSLADQGHINETVLSTESLGKAYGPLQQQVKDSIAKQQNLLSQIQVGYCSRHSFGSKYSAVSNVYALRAECFLY